MKKYTKTIVALVVVLSVAALAGCMRAANQPSGTPAPTVMPSPAPTAASEAAPTTTPGATAEAGQGQSGQGQQSPNGQPTSAPETDFAWAVQSSAVEGRINMFSEIEDSRVVVYDTTALVGVQFADAYKGELTQRIRDMIAGEVMAADQKIQVVAVTSEEADVTTIYQLSDKLKSGENVETLKDDIEKIVRNATTLR